ncbi:hypothetical protein DQ04_00221100 [Trypanosoma grayi]|uniref:hypothetical protein n=1 Tax=Trypanosoma grayi TaxID=71804 RepID=UPI0004F48D21|nr:hypothetical protein DQ04_00221100 [Trypanosoma grayi]KEG15007.1 hypothetical protein DQ04_00221100 [Trypanosoma grayi]
MRALVCAAHTEYYFFPRHIPLRFGLASPVALLAMAMIVIRVVAVVGVQGDGDAVRCGAVPVGAKAETKKQQQQQQQHDEERNVKQGHTGGMNRRMGGRGSASWSGDCKR